MTDVKLYVDGVLETVSSRLAAALNIVLGADVKVGRDFSTGYFFNGNIEDLRIYNKELTKAEIDAIRKK